MYFIRKSLKAYMIVSAVFLILSLILACTLNFSGFKENWTFAGLVAILSAASLLLGMMQGAAAGKRGLVIGMMSAMIFTAAAVFIACSVFADSFELKSKMLLYVLPVIMGGAGGVAGVGRNSK